MSSASSFAALSPVECNPAGNGPRHKKDLKKGSGCYMDTKCVSGERETV